MKTALSFDDVLLVPGMSKVESRKDVDLSCHLRQDLDEDETTLTLGPSSEYQLFHLQWTQLLDVI